mgnify:CR=1 FL=1
MLAHREPRKPRQASLRRGVSAAYYAVFHRLVEEATREIVPGRNDALRQRVGRAVNHGDVRKLCRSLVTWNVRQSPHPLDELLGGPPSPDVVRIAEGFVALQQARYEADYDMARRFVRDDVDRLVELADDVFLALKRLERGGNERRVFLYALAFHAHWKRVGA